MTHALAARDTFSTLQKVDPGNLDMLARLSFARLQVAEVAATLAQPELARLELVACGSALRSLLAADPEKPDWTIKLRGRWLAAQLPLADSATALHALRASTTEFLALHDGHRTQLDSDGQWILALAALRLGDAWAVDNPTQAEASWHTAMQDLTPLSGNNEDPRVTSLRANALWRLGQTQEAQLLADKLTALSYRHPEWQAELVRRLALRATH